MDDRQAEIGYDYTPVPHKVLDALRWIRIPGEARQMLDTIFRQTYGWHKIEDQISTSQFMEFTGLCKAAVHKNRRKLLEMNLIRVRRTGRGFHQKIFYSVQEDCSKWIPSQKKDSIQKRTRLYPKKDATCIPKGDPQKKLTKETSTTERISPEEDDLAIRKREAREELENEKRMGSGSTPVQTNIPTSPAKPNHTDSLPQMELLKDRWNARMPVKVMTLNAHRTALLVARMGEDLFVNNFDKIMDKILASDFLSGRKKSADSHFKGADFDWIIKDDHNYVKIWEGKFDEGRGSNGYGKPVRVN